MDLSAAFADTWKVLTSWKFPAHVFDDLSRVAMEEIDAGVTSAHDIADELYRQDERAAPLPVYLALAYTALVWYGNHIREEEVQTHA